MASVFWLCCRFLGAYSWGGASSDHSWGTGGEGATRHGGAQRPCGPPKGWRWGLMTDSPLRQPLGGAARALLASDRSWRAFFGCAVDSSGRIHGAELHQTIHGERVGRAPRVWGGAANRPTPQTAVLGVGSFHARHRRLGARAGRFLPIYHNRYYLARRNWGLCCACGCPRFLRDK